MKKEEVKRAKKVALAAFIGSAIEWYDFYIYALASVLIFAPLFFPNESPFIGLLASFASFALGFLARPIGAIIFGYIGDRFGRKKSLIITLFLMGLATTCVGLLPTYASIGVLAPMFLVILRIIQGIAVGGEWGGAVLLSNEHAPSKLKNFFSSFAQWGSPAGNVLALLVLSALMRLPKEKLFDQGYWRLPFLFSFILLIIGLIARFKLTESPVFLEAEKKQAEIKEKESLPLVALFKSASLILFLSIGANALSFSGIFSNTIMIGYTTEVLKVPKYLILDALFWVALVHFFSQPFLSYLSKNFRASRFLMLTAFLAALSVFLLFPLVNLGQKWSITLGISILVLCYSGFYGVIAGYLARVFPVRMRYTALSLSYQACAAIFGSLIPMIGAYLIYEYRLNWLPLAFFYSFLALLSIISLYFLEKQAYYEE